MVALGAIFVDQTAIDHGAHHLSWLLTGLQPVNFTTIRTHVPDGEAVYSPLVDPRWVAANLAYMRDLDYLASRNYAVKAGAPAKTGGDAAPPISARAKARLRAQAAKAGKAEGAAPAKAK